MANVCVTLMALCAIGLPLTSASTWPMRPRLSPRGIRRNVARRISWTARIPLWNDRDLRGLYFEGLELAGAALRIFRRHRVPHDAHRRIIGHDPLGDPELAF